MRPESGSKYFLYDSAAPGPVVRSRIDRKACTWCNLSPALTRKGSRLCARCDLTVALFELWSAYSDQPQICLHFPMFRSAASRPVRNRPIAKMRPGRLIDASRAIPARLTLINGGQNELQPVREVLNRESADRTPPAQTAFPFLAPEG